MPYRVGKGGVCMIHRYGGGWCLERRRGRLMKLLDSEFDSPVIWCVGARSGGEDETTIWQ